ncbi:murein L,D-transpeptidase catalytic domain family protein [Algoriphagus sp.]|uniref:murein L,D-transpeptidase catalytic domain family protein n=1 Tax=Algoriphagus sp. TaxID=1872435 RepID=UPI00261D7C7C|nr:murein L,D-transpeptidase catalytic domain family protein [Algoriphagus sp.]
MPTIHLISVILMLWFENTSILPSSTSWETRTEIPAKKEVSLYDRLKANYWQVPNSTILDLAMEGYQKLHQKLENPNLVIIDFSLPSTAKRLWVIDPKNGKVLFHSVVSHGRNSGQLMATQFSNRPESYQSSLGFFKTAETYQGKHGYSLRLDGLEKGVNDQARNRAIVIHGADYATEEFAEATGRLGRSLGCPALPSALSATAIDLMKDGALLFIYGNDPDYLSNPPLLQP